MRTVNAGVVCVTTCVSHEESLVCICAVRLCGSSDCPDVHEGTRQPSQRMLHVLRLAEDRRKWALQDRRLRLYHLSFTQTLSSGGDLHGEGEEGDARTGVGQRISKLMSRAEIGATAARCAADVGVDEVWPEWKHGKDEYGDSLLTLHGKGKAAESLAPPPQRASPLRAPTDGIECKFTP